MSFFCLLTVLTVFVHTYSQHNRSATYRNDLPLQEVNGCDSKPTRSDRTMIFSNTNAPVNGSTTVSPWINVFGYNDDQILETRLDAEKWFTMVWGIDFSPQYVIERSEFQATILNNNSQIIAEFSPASFFLGMIYDSWTQTSCNNNKMYCPQMYDFGWALVFVRDYTTNNNRFIPRDGQIAYGWYAFINMENDITLIDYRIDKYPWLMGTERIGFEKDLFIQTINGNVLMRGVVKAVVDTDLTHGISNTTLTATLNWVV